MEKIATRDAYGQTLVELGQENENIVVLDADLSQSTKTSLFARHFPERFFNMGIAEQDLMAAAAGFSLEGLIPFASTFAIFATGRAFEVIRNSIAYPRLNVKIAASHAGLTVGEDGASHQAIEDISLMRSLPNMRVIVPADAVETKKVVRKVAQTPGPFYIRLGRPAVPVILEEEYEFKIGRALELFGGKDAYIVACGIMVSIALEAAEQLRKDGLDVGLINMSTIKPLDEEMIVKVAEKSGALVTAEEHSVIGGLGSAVAEVLVKRYPVPLEMVGIRDKFGESGKPDELLHNYGLTSQAVYDAVLKVIERKKY